MAERDTVSLNINLSVRGYNLLQFNRSQDDQNLSFDEYIEKMALLGSFITRIQNTQEGVVLFQDFDDNQTLIDDKIAEEIALNPGNIFYFPPKQD